MELQGVIKSYKDRIDRDIVVRVSKWKDESRLKEACQYALLNGGKRFRPALVHIIADAIGKSYDVGAAAYAVECFHSASLIADDLPMMDDADERRGLLSTHKVFGEDVALLASYALIAEGYKHIAINAQFFEGSVGVLAVENVSVNTGIDGVTGGQFDDLHPEETHPTWEQLIEKKTAPLFEISFVLGWLFGGGDPSQLSLVKQLSRHFGVAFQIADDFDDINEDTAAVNSVLSQGVEAAYQYFTRAEQQFRLLREQLCLKKHPLEDFLRFLELKVTSCMAQLALNTN